MKVGFCLGSFLLTIANLGDRSVSLDKFIDKFEKSNTGSITDTAELSAPSPLPIDVRGYLVLDNFPSNLYETSVSYKIDP